MGKKVTNYKARLHTARDLFHPHHLDVDWKKKECLLVIILLKRDSFGASLTGVVLHRVVLVIRGGGSAAHVCLVLPTLSSFLSHSFNGLWSGGVDLLEN